MAKPSRISDQTPISYNPSKTVESRKGCFSFPHVISRLGNTVLINNNNKQESRIGVFSQAQLFSHDNTMYQCRSHTMAFIMGTYPSFLGGFFYFIFFSVQSCSFFNILSISLHLFSWQPKCFHPLKTQPTQEEILIRPRI